VTLSCIPFSPCTVLVSSSVFLSAPPTIPRNSKRTLDVWYLCLISNINEISSINY
jgi:hypothetical protein